MVNSSLGKLYILLSACKPEDERVKKRLAIQSIIESPEYKSFMVYVGGNMVRKYFMVSELEKLSISKLKDIEKIIKILEKTIKNLYATICYGNVYALNSIGNISLYSYDSIRVLSDMVSNPQRIGFNFTNIREEKVWKLFAPNTIKRLDNLADDISLEEFENFEIILAERLKKEKYCIAFKEISDKKKQYRNLSREKETVEIRTQILENKIFVKKMIWSILSFVVSLVIILSYQMHAAQYLGVAFYAVLLSLLWIKG